MDPNLFYLNYERLFEVLVTIVIFSFFIERALSVVFESRGFIKMYGAEDEKKGLKEIIALALSIAACVYWQFDALSIVTMSHEQMQIPGFILTGAIVAGGSKASIKLFQEMMGFMSNAEAKRKGIVKIK